MRLPNGYGSVYKLSGNRRKPWVARKTIGFKDNGQQIYKIIGYYAKHQEAIDALSFYNKNPYDIDTVSITFSEVFEKYFEQKQETISLKNQQDYRNSFNVYKKIHNKAFKDIKTAELQDIMNSCGKAYPTRRKIKVMLNQVYAYAIANDIIGKDYAKFVDIGKPDEAKTIRKPFTEKEIKILWESIDKLSNIDTILIMIYSGWRIGELLTLKNCDINLNEKTMTGGIKTDAGKNRLVPIHEKIFPIIEKRYNAEKEYLIDGPIPYATYLDDWDINMGQLKMSHKPHDCRHTFATLADNAGANKLAIKRIMGHASKDITDKVYTHKDIEELRKAIDLLK